MDVTDDGRETDDNRPQFMNASVSRTSTPSPIVAVSSTEHAEKALSPIVFTLPGMSTRGSARHMVNASFAMFVTVLGMFTCTRLWHRQKAFSPMSRHPVPTVTLVRVEPLSK